MSKSSILAELAKASTEARAMAPTAAVLQSVQPTSEADTLQWLTDNFTRCNTSWEMVTNATLGTAIAHWQAQHQPAEGEAIHASAGAMTFLHRIDHRLQLQPFSQTDPRLTVGISLADAAIAETGTLVMHAGSNNPASLQFLTCHHCVVLLRAGIFRCYEDYWQAHRTTAQWVRAINYISGPSRTADVEQTIELGAHGPLSLHVCIV